MVNRKSTFISGTWAIKLESSNRISKWNFQFSLKVGDHVTETTLLYWSKITDSTNWVSKTSKEAARWIFSFKETSTLFSPNIQSLFSKMHWSLFPQQMTSLNPRIKKSGGGGKLTVTDLNSQSFFAMLSSGFYMDNRVYSLGMAVYTVIRVHNTVFVPW